MAGHYSKRTLSSAHTSAGLLSGRYNNHDMRPLPRRPIRSSRRRHCLHCLFAWLLRSGRWNLHLCLMCGRIGPVRRWRHRVSAVRRRRRRCDGARSHGMSAVRRGNIPRQRDRVPLLRSGFLCISQQRHRLCAMPGWHRRPLPWSDCLRWLRRWLVQQQRRRGDLHRLRVGELRAGGGSFGVRLVP